MDTYRPRKFRPWAVPALVLRMVIYLLRHWPLFLIAALILSPVGPHLRIQYTYYDRGGDKHMIACDYFGSRGMITHRFGGRCPIVAIIDTRKIGRGF